MSVVQINAMFNDTQIITQENQIFVPTSPTNPKAVIISTQEQVAEDGKNCPHYFTRIPDNSIETYYSKGRFTMCDTCNTLLELDNMSITTPHVKEKNNESPPMKRPDFCSLTSKRRVRNRVNERQNKEMWPGFGRPAGTSAPSGT